MITIAMFMRTGWLTLQDPKQGRRHSTWWSLHSSSSRSDLDQPYELSPKKINGIICPPKINHMCVFCKLCTYLCLLVHVNNVVEGKLKAHLKIWWTLQMATFSDISLVHSSTLPKWFAVLRIPFSCSAFCMLPLCNYFIASWFWHFDIRVHDASYMDDVVRICGREHVVALSRVSWGWEKDGGNVRDVPRDQSSIIWKNTWGYLSTSRMESWNKIGLEIGDIYIFSHLGIGGLLGVSSFRKATPEAGAGGSQRCVDTLVRFPNLRTWEPD